jgi:rubrerythrin
MMYDFNADDIFEIAEQLEQNGARFYRTAAQAMNDEKARDLLLKLAAMEDDHKALFTQMRSQLTTSEKNRPFSIPKGMLSSICVPWRTRGSFLTSR